MTALRWPFRTGRATGSFPTVPNGHTSTGPPEPGTGTAQRVLDTACPGTRTQGCRRAAGTRAPHSGSHTSAQRALAPAGEAPHAATCVHPLPGQSTHRHTTHICTSHTAFHLPPHPPTPRHHSQTLQQQQAHTRGTGSVVAGAKLKNDLAGDATSTDTCFSGDATATGVITTPATGDAPPVPPPTGVGDGDGAGRDHEMGRLPGAPAAPTVVGDGAADTAVDAGVAAPGAVATGGGGVAPHDGPDASPDPAPAKSTPTRPTARPPTRGAAPRAASGQGHHKEASNRSAQRSARHVHGAGASITRTPSARHRVYAGGHGQLPHGQEGAGRRGGGNERKRHAHPTVQAGDEALPTRTSRPSARNAPAGAASGDARAGAAAEAPPAVADRDGGRGGAAARRLGSRLVLGDVALEPAIHSPAVQPATAPVVSGNRSAANLDLSVRGTCRGHDVARCSGCV